MKATARRRKPGGIWQTRCRMAENELTRSEDENATATTESNVQGKGTTTGRAGETNFDCHSMRKFTLLIKERVQRGKKKGSSEGGGNQDK